MRSARRARSTGERVIALLLSSSNTALMMLSWGVWLLLSYPFTGTQISSIAALRRHVAPLGKLWGIISRSLARCPGTAIAAGT